MMKKQYAILLSLFTLAAHASQDERVVPDSAFLIDTIQAAIFGQGGTEILTHADVTRPSLAGMQQSLEDLIFERLVFLDAQKYKIAPDEDAVDKYLAMVQKENNLTLDELKNVFASAGYTYEEGRQQFRVLQTVNSMLGIKIHSQVIVPRAQVQEYYEQNPVVQEAEYELQYGFMPYADKREAQGKALRHMAKTGREVQGIKWNDPFWVKQDEVADDKAFIFSMKKGEISEPIGNPGGYEIYRIVDKKGEYVPTLDERYHEIADILRRPVYEKLMEDYKKNLFDSVSIVNFD